MRDTRRSLVRQLVAAAGLALLLAGCTERPRDPMRGGLTAPTTMLRSSRGFPIVLACPAMPGVMKRGVAPGTQGDMNRNGVVCDQRIGATVRDRVLTTDDLLVPGAAAAR